MCGVQNMIAPGTIIGISTLIYYMTQLPQNSKFSISRTYLSGPFAKGLNGLNTKNDGRGYRDTIEKNYSRVHNQLIPILEMMLDLLEPKHTMPSRGISLTGFVPGKGWMILKCTLSLSRTREPLPPLAGSKPSSRKKI